MLENVCVVNRYCKLERKKQNKTKTRDKKKHVKHVIKSHQLIHFFSSIHLFDDV